MITIELIDFQAKKHPKLKYFESSKSSRKKTIVAEWVSKERGTSQAKYLIDEKSQKNEINFAILQRISKIFTLENPLQIVKFINKKPETLSWLLEASQEIRKYFPIEKLRLSYSTDPEIPQWEKLVLYILVNPEFSEDAFKKLDAFDENWWLDASSKADVNLCIDVDFE
ncbi:hypothetical protein F7734_27865 [Scytonema sp. UIC 10036]|uniref:hypothetical protein n=1 Tax=Scytonema sp. UIC 10036 TaxID=2304196 RepID=UPI0012DA54F0|nr:hypothetical protein [Scytonema sp. UIC 10036]MUG95961.1 hypothetical protein [Scytonema sp. UIC 10036]